jgi:hypothetical protein
MGDFLRLRTTAPPLVYHNIWQQGGGQWQRGPTMTMLHCPGGLEQWLYLCRGCKEKHPWSLVISYSSALRHGSRTVHILSHYKNKVYQVMTFRTRLSHSSIPMFTYFGSQFMSWTGGPVTDIEFQDLFPKQADFCQSHFPPFRDFEAATARKTVNREGEPMSG